MEAVVSPSTETCPNQGLVLALDEEGDKYDNDGYCVWTKGFVAGEESVAITCFVDRSGNKYKSNGDMLD